ncbi:MAG: CCA tRNA nucleotidyltransferase [bacterium]
MSEIKPPERTLHILRTLREAGHQALLAGGCVRDHLMGRTPTDWDVVTDAGPDIVMDLFEHTVPVGAKFGVVRVIMGDGICEVARFRKDDAYLDGRRPSAVHPASAEEDARRRDFTINGMFYDPLEKEVIDYVGGREDIERGCIRAIGDPRLRFEEDHLRLLRAVRFAARLGFEIEADTFAALQRLKSRIHRTSAERIRSELTMMLTGEHGDRAFQLLMNSGLLKEVLPEAAEMKGVEQPPEFHPEGDVWTHVMLMLARPREPGESLAWGILLHDVGKPVTHSVTDRIRFNGHAAAGASMAEEICERLQMSGNKKNRICELVKNHMKFMDVQKMRPSRLKRFLREPYFPELLELHRIDCLASHGNLATYEFCRERLEEIEGAELRPARLLDGYGLAELGFSPGPHFREILTALEDEQLEGRVRTREEAEAFVRQRYGPD